MAHLAPEVQMLIFEELNLTDLINVAQTNTYFHHLAAEIYRHKFQHKIIKIERKSNFDARPIQIQENSITFSTPTMAEGFLRVFGLLVTKIMLSDMKVNIEDAKRISKIINEFCSNSLRQLELRNSPMQIWNELKEPMKNVENLTLFNKFEISENVNLTKLFPSLRRLSLEFINSHDIHTFDAHFPHLKHLTHAYFACETNSEQDLVNLCRMNPQIHSLNLKYSSYVSLKIAGENLKNLTILKIYWPVWTGAREEADELRFENVRKLVLEAVQYIPVQVTFPQLEEMKVHFFPLLNDQSIEFLGRNNGLRKLDISNIALDAHILKLVNVLPNLIELSLDCGRDVSSKSIISFAQQHDNLKMIHLKYVDKSLGEKLNEEISNATNKHIWECTDFEENGKMSYQLNLRRIM